MKASPCTTYGLLLPVHALLNARLYPHDLHSHTCMTKSVVAKSSTSGAEVIPVPCTDSLQLVYVALGTCGQHIVGLCVQIPSYFRLAEAYDSAHKHPHTPCMVMLL